MNLLAPIFKIIITSHFIFSAPLERLDPHGAKNLNLKDVKTLKGHSECSICHTETKGSIKTKPSVEATCLNCHNKSPHSGVTEHLGKSSNSEKISCLTCHSPHRSTGKSGDKVGSFFAPKEMPNTDKIFFSSKPDSMLIKSCGDCHKW